MHILYSFVPSILPNFCIFSRENGLKKLYNDFNQFYEAKSTRKTTKTTKTKKIGKSSFPFKKNIV